MVGLNKRNYRTQHWALHDDGLPTALVFVKIICIFPLLDLKVKQNLFLSFILCSAIAKKVGEIIREREVVKETILRLKGDSVLKSWRIFLEIAPSKEVLKTGLTFSCRVSFLPYDNDFVEYVSAHVILLEEKITWTDLVVLPWHFPPPKGIENAKSYQVIAVSRNIAKIWSLLYAVFKGFWKGIFWGNPS